MRDLGSTPLLVSPEAAKAFRIAVVKRVIPGKTLVLGEQKIETERWYTIPLTSRCGNHKSFDEKDHSFKVMKSAKDYNTLLPAWYLNKHKAEGLTTGHLHFRHCGSDCFVHGCVRPDNNISYDKRVEL